MADEMMDKANITKKVVIKRKDPQTTLAKTEEVGEKTVFDIPDDFSSEVLMEYEKGIFDIGDLIKATVIQVDQTHVYVDLGLKSEGRIKLAEFDTPPKVGDELDVLVMSEETDSGQIRVSKKRADYIKAILKARESFEKGKYISGTVKEKKEKGFIVDIGNASAYLPFSQVPPRELNNIIGKTLRFKIINIKGSTRIILSRKEYLKEANKEFRDNFFKVHKEGDIVRGRIKGFVASGVIVDLGGFDGIVRKDDITWKKVTNPKSLLYPGDEMDFKILSIDREKQKVRLGIKQLTKNPWDKFFETYSAGQVVNGKVTDMKDFGAFVEILPGVEGLLHTSDISWRHIRHPKEVLKKGDVISVKILSIDKKNKKIALGLKQLQANPWDEAESRFKNGAIVKGRVKSINDKGAVIEFDEDFEGFLPKSELSWERVDKVEDVVKVGDEIDVVVLSFNKREKSIKVGYKQLQDNPFEEYRKEHPVGSVIKAKIAKILPNGVELNLTDKVKGFIHISQLSTRKIYNIEEHFKVGDEVEASVRGHNLKTNVVELSIRELEEAEQKKQMGKYIADENVKGFKLGDVMKIKL